MGHFYTSDGREIDSETTETALWTFFTEFYDFSGLVVEDHNITLKEYYFGVIDSDEEISGNPDLHRCMSGFSLGLAALSSEDIGRKSFIGNLIRIFERFELKPSLLYYRREVF